MTPEVYVTLHISGRPVVSVENPILCRLVAIEASKNLENAISAAFAAGSDAKGIREEIPPDLTL